MPFTYHNYITKQWLGKRLGKVQSDILFILHVKADRVVSMNEIIDFVYPNPNREPIDASGCIRVLVKNLRKKFGKNIITSQFGRGYQINEHQYHE